MTEPPFELREYQTACVNACFERTPGLEPGVLCCLPTNAGKTVIAAEVVKRTLQTEEGRKVVFLTPGGELARQQTRVLLRHVGPEGLVLWPEGGDDSAAGNNDPKDSARWRLGMSIGGAHEEDASDIPTVPWRLAFQDCQCLVMTPALLVKCLQHAYIRMMDIALLVIDEAHNIGDKRDDKGMYRLLMTVYYPLVKQKQRPRVLALTASPIEQSGKQVRRKL